MAEVVLQGVSKTYSGHVAAVQDLDLTILDQELVVLVGPSGCGKTTTLRLIAGLDHLDHGVIRIAGRNVERVAPHERNIAMVFQHSALYPHLTVWDNMAFGFRMRCGPRGIGRLWERWRRRASDGQPRDGLVWGAQVRRAAQRLRLDRLLLRKPYELSGGERQRVALGRAIVRRPAAFLLDEPLSHVDPPQRAALRQVIRSVQRQHGTTMVYVTHDQAEALSVGDRIAVMNQGRLHQVGSPQEIFQQPADRFVAQFIGEPGMNLVAGCLQQEYESGGRTGLRFVARGLALSLGPQTTTAWAVGSDGQRRVQVGIRPEHVQVSVGSGLLTRSETTNPRRPGEAATAQSIPHGGNGPVSWCARGWIEAKEFQGGTTVLHVVLTDESSRGHTPRAAAEGDCLRAVVADGQAFGVRQEVAIGWPLEKLHWFDADSGKNLNGAATPGTDVR